MTPTRNALYLSIACFRLYVPEIIIMIMLLYVNPRLRTSSYIHASMPTHLPALPTPETDANKQAQTSSHRAPTPALRQWSGRVWTRGMAIGFFSTYLPT
jgi:hypothetical protein